jgi:hypothetical protein
MKRRSAWACFGLSLFLVGATGFASPSRGSVGDQAATPAPSPVQAEVMLIHATNDGDGGVDPRIGKLPKFGDYKAYRLLSRSDVSIQKSAPASTQLPNGRVLQLNLKDVKNDRYIIDTSINQADGTTFLPLVEVRATLNVPVFFAGQSYQGGMLIIGIKILPK